MASTFKNAGLDVGTNDNSSNDLYTAPGAGTAVIHALYISNKDANNTAQVDIKVTTDGGTTFYHLGKSIEIQPENTLIFDKPINLESNDKIRVIAALNIDSTAPDVEAFASILEVT
jgi:hypothetical protein